jgi:hypothetical protein
MAAFSGVLTASASDLRTAFYIAAVSLALSAVVVLPASVLIGLPVATILRRRNAETLGNYLVIGAAAGGIIPLVATLALGGETWTGLGLAVLGFIAGAATACSLWLWRPKSRDAHPPE